MIYAIFVIIIILQLVQVVMNQKLYLDGDMTRETVNSFLAEDAVYRVNPMTGQAYTLGMPLRLKILRLPTLYGILCRSGSAPAPRPRSETGFPLAALQNPHR